MHYAIFLHQKFNIRGGGLFPIPFVHVIMPCMYYVKLCNYVLRVYSRVGPYRGPGHKSSLRWNPGSASQFLLQQLQLNSIESMLLCDMYMCVVTWTNCPHWAVPSSPQIYKILQFIDGVARHEAVDIQSSEMINYRVYMNYLLLFRTFIIHENYD